MAWIFSKMMMELCESLRSSQEPAVASSVECSSGGEQSAPSKSTNTQQAFLSHGKTTEYSRLSRFGMTYAPLTDDRGEELLTSFLADFHAKTYQLQAKGGGCSQEQDRDYGNKWQESLAKYDPNMCLWKTHHSLLGEDSTLCVEIFPRWGMTLNGELFPQKKLERRTKEKEFGSSQEKWPTPRSCSAISAVITPENANKKNRFANLETVVGRRTWPTPDTGAGGLKKNAIFGVKKNKNGNNVQVRLADAVMQEKFRKMFPTPTSHNAKETNCTSEKKLKSQTLASIAGGYLNPAWVEMLMGWPKNWTSLDPISHVEMCFWIIGFYDDKKEAAKNVLRVLQKGVASKEIQRTIGRFVSISEAAFLLAKLCQYNNKADEARIFMESKKIFEDELQSLQMESASSCASYESGYYEQYAEQHSDTMQALSQLLAHYGEKAWQDESWENAIARISDAFNSRRVRLTAIGNGQVPAVAATAWRILWHGYSAKR